MRESTVPAVASLLALAWITAQAAGLTWLAALAAAGALTASGAAALHRRTGRHRRRLAAGMGVLGVLLTGGMTCLLAVGGGDVYGLPAILAGAAALLLPVPLLYAWTFGPEDRPK